MKDASTPHLPTTESTPRRPAPEGGVARLVVTQGADAGATLVLRAARATVGRHPSNDLVLHDAHVSALHLELERRSAGRLLLRDPGSTNGTWIGTTRLVEAELAPGALVQLGGSALRIELDDRAGTPARSDTQRFGGLVGAAPEMLELFAVLERAADTGLPLLVQGEAGTGKEELARAVHGRSPRGGGPFVSLDAATLPSPLATSILLGHEPGALPDADAPHAGVFEQARGGTLYLDEVSELPPEVQERLFEVLETGEVTRLGASRGVPLDVRLIAATRRDLRAEIEGGRFREDLFRRLAGLRVVVPPLRSRPGDVELLVEDFLRERAGAGEVLSLEPAALRSLARRPWPGNVRELRNVLARAAALCREGRIAETDVAGEGYGFRGSAAEQEALDLAGTFAEAKGRAVERFERVYLEALVRRCGGNLSRASREADLARNHLRHLLKKRGLYAPGDS